MKFLRLFHRWLGLGLSLVVMAIALSGGILIFHDTILRLTWPELTTPIKPDQHDSYPKILTHLEDRFTNPTIQLLKFPDQDMNAFHLWLNDDSEALVGASSGDLIHTWTWDETLIGILFEFHVHLLAGEQGEQVNGFLGLVILGFVVSGVILWWPRRQKWRLRHAIPQTSSSLHFLRSHSVIGIVFSASIVLFVATGTTMVFYRPIATAITSLLDSSPPVLPSANITPTDLPVLPWTKILQVVYHTLPEGKLVYYLPPKQENAVMTFRKRMPGEWHPNGRSFLLLNPYTAEVVQTIDAREQQLGMSLMEKVYPLHASKVGGMPYTILALYTSVALIVLGLFGILSYISRTKCLI